MPEKDGEDHWHLGRSEDFFHTPTAELVCRTVEDDRSNALRAEEELGT
jgi:hypothetical protein